MSWMKKTQANNQGLSVVGTVHHRKSIRLKGYDYTSSGGYFVTVVTCQRKPLFGEIVHGEMKLTNFGNIIIDEWFSSMEIRNNVELFDNEFIVMPNHIHGIIWITNDETNNNPVGVWRRQTPTNSSGHDPSNPQPKFGKPIAGSLSTILGAFKSKTTKRINHIRETRGETIWQRGFFDRIIRDEKMYNNVINYIMMNPLRWETDSEYYANGHGKQR